MDTIARNPFCMGIILIVVSGVLAGVTADRVIPYALDDWAVAIIAFPGAMLIGLGAGETHKENDRNQRRGRRRRR